MNTPAEPINSNSVCNCPECGEMINIADSDAWRGTIYREGLLQKRIAELEGALRPFVEGYDRSDIDRARQALKGGAK